jgi:uncharacterized protein YndB with AHSA1/START domain
MTTQTDMRVTTQVYRVYIKATPQAIWDAITRPEWTARYGYGGIAEWEPELKPGATYRGLASDEMKAGGAAAGIAVPDVAVDGEVIEVDPPHRLVQTWRMLMDPDMVAEGFTRLTFEIAETKGGVSKLTVTHELEGAPKLALLLSGALEEQGAGGGWPFVLSDLKSLLESGARMDATDPLNFG